MKKEYVLHTQLPLSEIEEELNLVIRLKTITTGITRTSYRTCMLSEEEIVVIKLKYGDLVYALEVDIESYIQDLLKDYTSVSLTVKYRAAAHSSH